MAENVYVVGHKSPDTDSVCAAISLANLKSKLGQEGVVPCRAGKLNKETEYVLEYFGVESPQLLSDASNERLILVDHNEIGQAVDGAQQAKIIEIYDHHRLGGLQTAEPLLFRNEPIGSTCTVIANVYKENGVTPEKSIAGIMLAAILSDTVIFKSPTCTAKDKETAEYLEKIAGVEAKNFGVEMFKASSNLKDRKPEDMIEEDLKEFTFGGMKVGIGQVSAMGTDGVEELRPALVEAMNQIKGAKGWSYLLLMVTDLLEECTDLIIVGEQPETIAAAFDKPVNNGSVILPGVLSRKKQIVPPLTSHFEK